jgi:hypothetical protein
MTKPAQIISVDFQGRHNADLEKTSSRILRGGSWKKQRIIVLIPSSDMIPAVVALSHWNMVFPPNQAVYRMLCLGMEVGDAYSQAITNILGHPDLSQWEYLLTVEHDNLGPNDGVLKLVEDMEQHPEFSCIGGLYFTKGEGGCAQIWGDPKDPVLNFRPQVPLQDTLQECVGTGMGFNLWRLSMFREGKLKQPFFKTKADKEGVGTQDLQFWGEARKHGYRCAIDTAVRVGHLDSSTGIVW